MLVHCKKNNYDIYIGRPSKWGNPFEIGKYGTREDVILKYKLWLNTQPKLLIDVKELKGKTLGCWCSPKPCHGEILKELSESKYIKNWFSNMLPFDNPLIYQGIEYLTVENFYQAMKIPKDKLELRKELSLMKPFESKKQIRDKNKFIWDSKWTKDKSLKVMEYALKHKFKKETSWGKLLVMTEDWEITEWNNWGDTFWGKDIRTKNGDNNLGKILMKIRNNI